MRYSPISTGSATKAGTLRTTVARRTTAGETVLAVGLLRPSTAVAPTFAAGFAQPAAPALTIGGFAQPALIALAPSVATIASASVSSLALAARLDRATVGDIQAQQPMVGFVERTVSVAERLHYRIAVLGGTGAQGSGLALRHGVTCLNSPGLIDAGYRAELRVVLVNTDPDADYQVRRGDRIAQLVVQPVEEARFTPVEALEPSERGLGGFGHSGT